MNTENLKRLAALLSQRREDLLAAWRRQVRELPSARHLDTPTLNDHVPRLLKELTRALAQVDDQTIPEAMLEGSPPAHGLQRHEDGFDIVEVVGEYNILRGCIHDLAEANGIQLGGKSFHILNRVLDEAISLAVQTFATAQALEVQRRREEYLAFVAHDLRTPLNAIALIASLLEAELAEPGGSAETAAPGARPERTAARRLKTLQRSVRHLESLVGKVLKESAHVATEGGVRLERRELDLWPFVESLLHDLQPLAEGAGTTLTNAVPDEAVAYADAGTLRRVFENLIANSITYAPRGLVEVGAHELSDGGAIECWVRDNGAGIPADRIERVFDKLETDPDKEGGTGLGLAIVKSFVEAHGGAVRVESAPGAGATFWFTLPR